MGYDTAFEGVLKFAGGKKLQQPNIDYLLAFANRVHSPLHPDVVGLRPDPLREAVGLDIGEEGCFFVGELKFRHDPAFAEGEGGWSNAFPDTWCRWVPTPAGDGMEWNGAEKTYASEEWLQWLQDELLGPWGLELEGHVFYHGNTWDIGIIFVQNAWSKKAGKHAPKIHKLPVLEMKNVFGACARGELAQLSFKHTWHGRPERPRERLVEDPSWYSDPAGGKRRKLDWDIMRLHPADPGSQMPFADGLVHACFGFGMKPLHLALVYGHVDLAAFILKVGGHQQLCAHAAVPQCYDGAEPGVSGLRYIAIEGCDCGQLRCTPTTQRVMAHLLPPPQSFVLADPADNTPLTKMLNVALHKENGPCVTWAIAAGASVDDLISYQDVLEEGVLQLEAAGRAARELEYKRSQARKLAVHVEKGKRAMRISVIKVLWRVCEELEQEQVEQILGPLGLLASHMPALVIPAQHVLPL